MVPAGHILAREQRAVAAVPWPRLRGSCGSGRGRLHSAWAQGVGIPAPSRPRWLVDLVLGPAVEGRQGLAGSGQGANMHLARPIRWAHCGVRVTHHFIAPTQPSCADFTDGDAEARGGSQPRPLRNRGPKPGLQICPDARRPPRGGVGNASGQLADTPPALCPEAPLALGRPLHGHVCHGVFKPSHGLARHTGPLWPQEQGLA